MNHPKHEEWPPYLFGEANPAARQRLSRHLQDCSECREEIGAWQRSLVRLDAWKLPKTEKARETLASVLRWAAAAALVLGLGFGIGRLSSAANGVEKIRAAIEPEIRQQLGQEFAQLLRDERNRAASTALAALSEQTRDLLADFESKRAQDNQAIYTALDKLYLSLKKDVDTVAVNTDASLRSTEQQLVQLAGYKPPVNVPISPEK